MYVIFQTRLVLALLYTFLCYRHSASARFVELVYEFEHGKHAARMRVGPEERSESLVYLSRLEYARQIFVRDADAGVGLAVLEQYVVARIVFLYETVFEQ